MQFERFSKAVADQVTAMVQDGAKLFLTDVVGDFLWETYIASFPAGTNPLFKKRTEHDCSACKHFIRRFGGVVTLKDGKVRTIWDIALHEDPYQTVADAMARVVRNAAITDIFVTHEALIGVERSIQQISTGLLTWSHLHAKLPPNLVAQKSSSLPELQAAIRDVKTVLKRSLDELNPVTVETVFELIVQRSLYKGEEWEGPLRKFYVLLQQYHNSKLNEAIKDRLVWEWALTVGPVVGKIYNHSIGTLLKDIESGIDLDEAVKRYEAIVAPSNYKRPKPIFTRKMLENAQKTLEDLGMTNALGRRFAVTEDVSVTNVLFADRDAVRRMKGSVFDEMAQSVAVNPRDFSRVEEIGIDEFIKNVLPSTTSISALFESRHGANRVSVIAPQDSTAPTLFKWGNPFSWAYTGNLTDSMRERVKAMGGRVDGAMRFSIQWNDNDDSRDDLDAHCIEPGGEELCFYHKCSEKTDGELDVDIIFPDGVAVENIIHPSERQLREGAYQFFVHCYNSRGARSGFTAEVECGGQTYSFAYNKHLHSKETVAVADVYYSHAKGFEVRERLPSTTSSRKLWGVDTNQFLPVELMMYSPNYWDKSMGIGNRHYFFILQGMFNDENPSGFFNEYLREDLMKYKRVFEALGNKMRVENSASQLSGLGFCSTKRDSVIVKIEGAAVKRTLKIQF
jgi:hypothetical protein